MISIIGAAFFLSLLLMARNAEDAGSYWFEEYHIKFKFWKHLFVPYLAQIIIYYCGYISINKFLEEKKDDWSKAGTIFGLYLITATLISISNTYTDAWKFGKYDRTTAFINFFTDGFSTVAIIFLIYTAYYILKELVFKIIAERNPSTIKKSNYLNAFLILAGWVALLIVSGANNSSEGLAIFGVGVPFIIAIVFAHIKFLIPISGAKRYKSKAYLWRAALIVFVLSIVGSGISTGIIGNSDMIVPISMAWMFFAVVVVIPVCWYISKNAMEKEVLQTALGSSQATLSFLRSQINPHFLFNALNTLYGMALQENAERTGEGIQKLGDMMRFMLHENMQDKISLTRETEYLNNYIDLQKLRIATSPNIVLQTNIEAQLNPLDISPMLLIPFVENAFKHGISLQQPSFINVSLHTRENVLYLDVSNSVHIKSDYDPEKMKSGIGLQNVKQRLALLYPKRHELIIRQSAKEFFVHLTMQL